MLDDAPLPVSPCVEINQCVGCNFDFHTGFSTTKVREEEITHHETLLGYTGTCQAGPALARVLGRDGRPGSRVVLETVSSPGTRPRPPCIVEPWERRGWRKKHLAGGDRCLVYPLPQPWTAEQMLAWSEAQGGVRVTIFRTGRLADSL